MTLHTPQRLALPFTLLLMLPPASAQLVADPAAPGNRRPTVLEAANGVPVVNIQTPSAAGVSRNTFRQFDVDPKGVILNNARTGASTQLGGWVQGNPWLATGTARVILNEVNSSSPSSLRGYIEVGGNRAQVVVANPSGISCDGCGFINADRAAITTGVPAFLGGALDGYRVSGGHIAVLGKGLDAGATTYTALISRSLEVNAGIWAKDLHVTTGVNEVGADASPTRALSPAGAAVAFAIDVGALGGMYGQKILLVGTEHGVGVRNAGVIGAQAGHLTVTADGRLENRGVLQAMADVDVRVKGGMRNAGTVSAAGELRLASGVEIDNRGGTLNARRVQLEARSLGNQGGIIEQTGGQALLLNAGALRNREGGRIGLAPEASPGALDPEDAGLGDAGQGSPASGSPGTAGPASRPGGGANAGNAPVRSGVPDLDDGAIAIAGPLDNAGGRIVAGGVIDVRVSADADNDAGRIGVRHFELTGGDLSNRGGDLRVSGNAGIVATRVDNDRGAILLGGRAVLSAQQLSNRSGSIRHSDKRDAVLTVTGGLDNSAGVLASNAAQLRLSAGKLVNTGGKIAHAGDGLSIITDTLSGARGEISTAGRATLRLGESDHDGAVLTARQIDLRAASVRNLGGQFTVLGNDANVFEIAGAFDNTAGKVRSNADLQIGAGTWVNTSGEILHAGTGLLAVSAGTFEGARGILASNGELHLAGEALELTGAEARASAVRLDAGRLSLVNGSLVATGKAGMALSVRDAIDNRGGVIASTDGALSLAAGSWRNTGGRVQSGAALRLDSRGEADNTGGLIFAGDALSVTASSILNGDTRPAAGAALQGVHAGSVSLQAARIDNTGGAINAARRIDLLATGPAATLENTRGEIATDGSVSISANEVSNSAGTLLAGQSLSIKADTLDGNGTLRSRGSLDLDLRRDFTNLGDITVNGHAVVNVAGRFVNRGSLHAEDLDVAAVNVDNTASGAIVGGRARVSAQATLTNRGVLDGADIRLDAGTISNIGTGRIYGDRLALHADLVENHEEGTSAATIAARQRLDIGAVVLSNREQALIFSAGEGNDALSVGGSLDANGNASGRAATVTNDSAVIESMGGLTIDSQRLLNRNRHFKTSLVQVAGPAARTYIQPDDSPRRGDLSEFAWENWSHAGRYRQVATGEEVRAWTQFIVTQTEYETQVVESAPSLLRAGGAMTLRGGELTNDQSRIIAGGVLQGDLANLDNIAASGVHITRQVGTSQYTHSRWRGGTRNYHQREWDDVLPYTPADIVQTISLDVSEVSQNVARSTGSTAIAGKTIKQVAAAPGTERVPAPGGAVGHHRIAFPGQRRRQSAPWTFRQRFPQAACSVQVRRHADTSSKRIPATPIIETGWPRTSCSVSWDMTRLSCSSAWAMASTSRGSCVTRSAS